ncbi:MAG: hypothetical protein D3908_13530, partial [Candidatus Electrothrix sp. AUS4]|nr:hypothetical protein [Candidatus Electrothrix sp. AUS4]
MKHCRYSLYTILWLIVVTTVLVLTTFSAVLSYHFAKNRIIAETSLHSQATISSLKNSIAKNIESYAVNEYEDLILNEMDHAVFSAIIIHDHNMGAILSQQAYISGKIRDRSGQVRDFDPKDADMLRQLEESFLSFTVKMTSAAGQELGILSLYGSNKKIEQELQKTIKESLINTFFLSLTLSLLLFFSIQHFVLRPLADIVTAFSQVDENGIPSGKISPHGALEIANLAKSLKKMISVIRKSRQELEAQHTRLVQNEKSLSLAEEKQREILWATNVGT